MPGNCRFFRGTGFPTRSTPGAPVPPPQNGLENPFSILWLLRAKERGKISDWGDWETDPNGTHSMSVAQKDLDLARIYLVHPGEPSFPLRDGMEALGSVDKLACCPDEHARTQQRPASPARTEGPNAPNTEGLTKSEGQVSGGNWGHERGQGTTSNIRGSTRFPVGFLQIGLQLEGTSNSRVFDGLFLRRVEVVCQHVQDR